MTQMSRGREPPDATPSLSSMSHPTLIFQFGIWVIGDLWTKKPDSIEMI